MRVLYLTELLTDGGTAKHLTEMLPWLRAAGVQATVWSRGEQGRYAREMRESGIDLRVVPAIGPALLNPARTRGVDLVHSYLYGAHVSDALACALRRLPYLKSTRNSGHWFTDRPAVRARVRLRTPLVRFHVVNSTGVADYLVEHEQVRRERITVIPNGMLDRYEEDPRLARCDIGVADEDFVLLSVAWLKARKSLDFLIRALAALRATRPRLKLVLAGDGPEEARLRALAAGLGVADACRFLGRHRSPHALSRLADVSVSASSEEGMSNSLIEAQMMGLPVVACLETAGNAEIVRDGVNGYLYPAGDQARFQACIAALYDGTALLARMREAARRTFLERFTMAAQVQGYLQLYRRILGRAA